MLCVTCAKPPRGQAVTVSRTVSTVFALCRHQFCVSYCSMSEENKTNWFEKCYHCVVIVSTRYMYTNTLSLLFPHCRDRQGGVNVNAVGSCRVPGGRGWLGGLPLDFSLLTKLLLQSCLHLGRDVRRCLADLHGCLQELYRAPSVHLHLRRALLLHLHLFTLGDRWGVGRRRLGETHMEAIFSMG